MKIIGVDIGTTSVSGVLVDGENGAVLCARTENHGAFLPAENEWEKIQDAELLLRVATGLIDELITPDTAAIGVTGQMHGILYFDENGNAVSPLYTWQDGRGGLAYRDGKSYAEHLSLPVGYGAVSDLYNRENGLVPATAVGFCTVYDYLAMRLTGRKTPLVHASSAASVGAYDLDKMMPCYNFGGEHTASFATVGRYRGIPVGVPIGDNQASVFGALSGDTDALLNFGTGSQISVVSSTPKTGNGIETRPYVGGKYLLVGAALCGGRAYALLERFFAETVYLATGKRESAYALLDRIPEANGKPIVADTRFSGTRSDSTVTGALSGITTENFTPAHLKSAFLSGMVEELYSYFVGMNQTATRLVGSGNGIRKNSALVKRAEVVFGAPMKIPVHREEAAFGAALFALVCAGIKTDGEVKSLIRYG